MKIEIATEDLIWTVATRMRDADLREILAIREARTRHQLAEELAAEYGNHPGAIVAVHPKYGPVAAGAAVMHRPNVMSIGCFATDDFHRIVRPLTRFVKGVWFAAYRDTGVHRISCMSIADYTAAHRWIEVLGLRRECAMPGFGKNGETFVSYAWVKDAGATGA